MTYEERANQNHSTATTFANSSFLNVSKSEKAEEQASELCLSNPNLGDICQSHLRTSITTILHNLSNSKFARCLS